MNILIPMAGAGSRFAEKGYKAHKPVIPTTNWRTGQKIPMVVAAVMDLPVDPNAPDNNIIFVVRDFHVTDGVCDEIKNHFPRARFIVVDKLTEGQACTCLLAKAFIDNDAPLFIAACDNGMICDRSAFDAMAQTSDSILFTFRNNSAVEEKPTAYGWVRTQGADVTGVSVKVPISDTPRNDHAIVGTFWFAHGHDFVTASETMIAANDRINGEFYVDQVFKYVVEAGQKARVFEIEKYLCWGTPTDYEAYEQTLTYWTDFQNEEKKRS